MQFTRDVVNWLRYQAAVTTNGQNVLVEAAKWNYQGGNYSIKEYYENILNLPKNKYKILFNAQQRSILSAEPSFLLDIDTTFRGYDISLLYVVLQNFCGLDANTLNWTSASGSQLENLIYKLKQERNNIAHLKDIGRLSNKELKKKLNNLKGLLSAILRGACISSGRPVIDARILIRKMKTEFKQLMVKVREPLSHKDLDLLPQLQDEIRVFHKCILEEMKENSRKELCRLYPKLWGIPIAQWLYPDLEVQPSLSFTKLIIKEDVKWSHPSQQVIPLTISHTDLLEVKRRDLQLPEVLIISGDGGMGKTTLLKFMIESWVEDSLQIKGLTKDVYLLYFQLRGSTIDTWKDLLKNILQKTYQDSNLTIDFFEELFSKLSIILLLDGYDEANDKSTNLIADLANIQNGMRIVITTRPGCLKELSQIMENKKVVMKVEIKGILKEDRSHFIENTLAQIEKDAIRRTELKETIIKALESLNMFKDELDVPLTMTLLIIREAVAPNHSTADIYEDLTCLMMGKIAERLRVRNIPYVDDKIQEYHQFQKKIALQSLKRSEFDLWPQTVEDLKTKSRTLDLPYEEMLSGFLTSKFTQKGFLFERIWSYPHNKFQEHWASGYIVNEFYKWERPDLDLPPAESFSELIQNNPIAGIVFDNKENTFQWEGSQSADVLVDVMCKFMCFILRSQKENFGKYAPAVVNLLFYSDCSKPVKRKNCDRICQLMKATGNITNIVEACMKVLNGCEVLEVHEVFWKEFIAMASHVRPQRVIIHPSEEEDEDEEDYKQEKLSMLQDLLKQNIEVIMKKPVSSDTISNIIEAGEGVFKAFNKLADVIVRESENHL